MRIILLAFLVFIFFAFPSYAGGSYGLVKVESLKMLSSIDYILVVAPVKNDDAYKTPYMGECEKFEVHGTYGWLKGSWISHFLPWMPEITFRENHLQALQKLKQYVGKDKPLQFGFMGSGFKILDEKNPCVVESKALELYEDGAIYSYYYQI